MNMVAEVLRDGDGSRCDCGCGCGFGCGCGNVAVVAAVVCASHRDGCNAAVAMATDARHQRRQ